MGKILILGLIQSTFSISWHGNSYWMHQTSNRRVSIAFKKLEDAIPSDALFLFKDSARTKILYIRNNYGIRGTFFKNPENKIKKNTS
jgi:hypothetical protein